MGSIALIIKILRTFGRYTALLPLVREVIVEVKNRNWERVTELIAQLIEEAGVLTGKPVLFGARAMPTADIPQEVEAELAALEAGGQGDANVTGRPAPTQPQPQQPKDPQPPTRPAKGDPDSTPDEPKPAQKPTTRPQKP